MKDTKEDAGFNSSFKTWQSSSEGQEPALVAGLLCSRRFMNLVWSCVCGIFYGVSSVVASVLWWGRHFYLHFSSDKKLLRVTWLYLYSESNEKGFDFFFPFVSVSQASSEKTETRGAGGHDDSGNAKDCSGAKNWNSSI